MYNIQNFSLPYHNLTFRIFNTVYFHFKHGHIVLADKCFLPQLYKLEKLEIIKKKKIFIIVVFSEKVKLNVIATNFFQEPILPTLYNNISINNTTIAIFFQYLINK